MIDYWCPRCDNHIRLELWSTGEGDRVEAWCCTAHLRPVRMVEQDPHAVAEIPQTGICPRCGGMAAWPGRCGRCQVEIAFDA